MMLRFRERKERRNRIMKQNAPVEGTPDCLQEGMPSMRGVNKHK